MDYIDLLREKRIGDLSEREQLMLSLDDAIKDGTAEEVNKIINAAVTVIFSQYEKSNAAPHSTMDDIFQLTNMKAAASTLEASLGRFDLRSKAQNDAMKIDVEKEDGDSHCQVDLCYHPSEYIDNKNIC